MDDLDTLLRKLEVPSEYRNFNSITEQAKIAALEEWKRQSQNILTNVRAQTARQDSLSVRERAQVVAAVAPFYSEGPWVSEMNRGLVEDILQSYATPDNALLEELLSQHVKPVFQSSPHPMLNVNTGRTLPRSAGGPNAVLDHLEGQTWKGRPGAVNLLDWCIQHCEGVVYEKHWHLIIPPVMTLLDDYETSNKLRGIHIVKAMLQQVPADLLRRTGVDGLLFSSLKRCLSFLQNPETPDLIRAAASASVSLTVLTTPPGSAQRFDQLCEILGDGIIGSVWFYAMHERDAIQASIDILPEVVHALGIGTARYLKAIIPQLVFPLIPADENAASAQLRLSSLHALCCVIKVCGPRVHRWKGQILEGTLKSWVALHDEGGDGNPETEALRNALKDVHDELLVACPSLAEAEYARLLQVDREIFEPLVRTSAKG